jgi:hypothetical protein
MLHGMGHWRRRRSLEPSAVLNPPTVAALGIGVGACGYLLTSRSHLGGFWILLIALVVGAASLSGMIVLMAKWALRNPATSHDDEDDVNGQVATVTRSIMPGEQGEISWFAWNQDHFLPARSMHGELISEGEEVVIDVVENGVASVELWSVVEQRL